LLVVVNYKLHFRPASQNSQQWGQNAFLGFVALVALASLPWLHTVIKSDDTSFCVRVQSKKEGRKQQAK
jgi:hypothetical protein